MFRWTPHRRELLREFWADFVLVMETLEENQVEKPTSLAGSSRSRQVTSPSAAFLTHVSTGSRCPAGSEQDRCSDPNDGERQSR